MSRNEIGDLISLVVSAVAAVIAPLQVFLLAFAILGPIHYLTEIAWLRKNKFYLDQSNLSVPAYVTMAGIAVVVSQSSSVFRHDLWFWTVGAMLMMSLTVLVKSMRVLALIAGFLFAIPLVFRSWVFVVAAIVPTLVHVFVFTFVFMISGVRRSTHRSWAAWLNPILMLLIPLLLMLLRIHYAPPAGIWLKIEDITFSTIHATFSRHMHHPMRADSQILDDTFFAGMARVFAFAYLFHYLNWFSKTELLKWHKLSTRSWLTLTGLYVVCILLYTINLRIGLVVAGLLSLLHVFLEFPLDWTAVRFVVGGDSQSTPKRRATLRMSAN